MAQPNNNPKNNPPGGLQKPTPRTGNTPPTARTLPPPSTANKRSAMHSSATTTTGPKRAAGAVRPFLFDQSNYRFMLLGLGLILLGLFLMAGGKSPDPHVFRYDEVFSFRRVTLAPVIMMIGFGLEFYAILKRPKAEVANSAIAVEMTDEAAQVK